MTKLTRDTARVTELREWASNIIKDDNRLQGLLPSAVDAVIIREQRKWDERCTAATLQGCCLNVKGQLHAAQHR